MKIFVVAYLVFAAAAMVLQAVATDLWAICESDNIACGDLLREQAWHAVTWPHFMILSFF